MTFSPSTTEIGRLQAVLGERYTVEREIARGGWASVYRARDRKHDRVVAIKVFHPELAHTLGPERFLQEIRLVAQFQHPYILPLYDSGETAESLYYVMPFVDGETLRDRIAREHRLPLDEALAIARDVLSALAYAHDRGVVHRDIKPENILLSGGHALVADFGIARAVSAARGERLSRPGIAVGTPAYMAPEQALGGDEADARSDVYGVGCLLHEMLAGEPPFRDATIQAVIDRHAEDLNAPDLAAARDDVPETVARAVARALALTPGERFPTARAFADAITPPTTPVAPTWPPSVAERRRRRSRRWRVAAVAALVAPVAAFALWRWLGPDFGPVSPTAVAVLPFTVNGGREYHYLRAGMVDLLGTDLDGAGDLRSVDPHAVVGTLGADTSSLTPARARAVATRLGAGQFVLGSVTEVNGRLRIHATLYDSTGESRPLAQGSAEGEGGRIFDLVDEVAAELLAGVRHGPGGRLTRLAAVTTQSLPALKLYLDGEQQLRVGHPDSAMQSFGAAVGIDPRFALAAYRRAVAADWAANFAVAREAGEQALRLSPRLAPDDRHLLEAFLAWHHGDAARAEDLYRRILVQQPDNVEAWYQLGEVLFHYGATRGRSFAAARPAFERARFLDPQNTSVVFHLLDIAAREGRMADFDQLLRDARGESAILLRRRALRAFSIGDRVERDRMLDELAASGDGTVIVSAGAIAGFRRDLDDAARVAALLTAPTRRPSVRAYGHLLLAQIEAARGRWRAAFREVDAAAPLDSAGALEMRAYLATVRWIPVPLSEVEALRARLIAWDGSAPAHGRDESPAVLVHDDVHPAIRLYLIGMLSARLGDAGSAERFAAALERLPLTPEDGTLAADLATGIRASVAWSTVGAAAALSRLEAMPSRVPLDRLANSAYFNHAHERFMRAELLRMAGRSREAAGWYDSLGEGRHDILFLVPSQLRLGAIYEAAGDAARARAAYALVVELWQGAEPDMQPMVAEARAGLTRLWKK